MGVACVADVRAHTRNFRRPAESHLRLVFLAAGRAINSAILSRRRPRAAMMRRRSAWRRKTGRLIEDSHGIICFARLRTQPLDRFHHALGFYQLAEDFLQNVLGFPLIGRTSAMKTRSDPFRD